MPNKCSFGVKDITLEDVLVFALFMALMPLGMFNDWRHRQEIQKLIEQYQSRH